MMLQSLLVAASLAAVTPEMLNRAYSNDMATAAGRMRWHGRVVETVATTETNAAGVAVAVITATHEDGWTFRTESRAVPASDASKRSRAALARLAALQARTNGVPVRLAEAIARRAEEMETTAVTNITVTVGRPAPTPQADK